MDVVFATRNADKILEIREILTGLPIEWRYLDEFPAGLPETVEDGATFLENALKKAREVCEYTKLPAIADDSGLCVDALLGEPGIYSARFSGGGYAENNEKLLRALDGVEPVMRGAHFICVAVMVMSDGEQFVGRGRLDGRITEKGPRGHAGFGYDPIFELADGRTLAEISSLEKSAISHRGHAFRELKKIITEIL